MQKIEIRPGVSMAYGRPDRRAMDSSGDRGDGAWQFQNSSACPTANFLILRANIA